jgi:hypothetical protein
MLKDLWEDEDDFVALTDRLNPKTTVMGGFTDV